MKAPSERRADASRRVMEKCGMYDRFAGKELSDPGAERDLTYYAIRRKPDAILGIL